MTYDEVMTALRNAHAAGDQAAAQRLAALAQSLRQPAPDVSGGDNPSGMQQPARQLSPYQMQPGETREAYEARLATLPSPELTPEAQALQERSTNEIVRPLDYRLMDNLVGYDDGVMSPGEKTAAALNLAGEGLSFGVVGDEANAGFDALIGRGNYDERLDRYRSNEAQFQEENPVLAFGAEVIPAMAAPYGALANVGGIGRRMATGGILGALGGGTYGFMEGEGGLDERIDSARNAGILGAIGGAAAPVLVAGVQRGVDGLLQSRAVRNIARNAPSMDDLRARATALYNQADQAAALPRTGLAPAVQGITDDARNLAMDPMLTPTASRVADNLADAATSPDPNITFRELDVLRRQANIPAGDFTNPAQAAIGSRMIEGIDDFIDQADPALSEALGEARDMWSRLRRSETIENAISRAQNQASGFENGIRVQFRALLNNPRAMRGFTAAEREAIEGVVRGSTLGNAMRLLGKFGFDFQQNTNALGAALGAGVGSLGGLPFAIGVPAVGSAARFASERMTNAGANRVLGLLANGGISNVPQVSQAGANAAQQGLLGMVAPSASNVEMSPREIAQLLASVPGNVAGRLQDGLLSLAQ
jgi:hypothetical protein